VSAPHPVSPEHTPAPEASYYVEHLDVGPNLRDAQLDPAALAIVQMARDIDARNGRCRSVPTSDHWLIR
jgi:hypothetical protein